LSTAAAAAAAGSVYFPFLQLVQALRFEAFDDSRLARFLVARAAANPAFAIFLHWWVGMWPSSTLVVQCAMCFCSST
jgi:hypothetical protein